MTDKKFYEITIENGKVQAEGHGFKGEGCQVIADLIASLGDDPTIRRKPEYFQKETGRTARRLTE